VEFSGTPGTAFRRVGLEIVNGLGIVTRICIVDVGVGPVLFVPVTVMV